MPVVGIPLDELFARLGQELAPPALEDALHRFGCSVEGWATVARWSCPACGALSESGEGEDDPPPICDGCGADLRGGGGMRATLVGRVKVLRMELLAVRPDLFDAAGLARGLAGFLGLASGPPAYRLERGEYSVDVDPALAGPDVIRPRIAAATVHGVAFDDPRLRSLMKLQDNIHWALGRDRRLASIGVYDLGRVRGRALAYRAVARDGVRFVPLGFALGRSENALTPAEILARHPKGQAYAWLLEPFTKVPLLVDAEGQVLSMPPIINGESTKVTRGTTDLLIDVTGTGDRHVARALNLMVSSLLETNPQALARTVEIRFKDGALRTPDFAPQELTLDAAAAGRLIGVPLAQEQVIELLRRMRHEARPENDRVRVFAPAWRADIMHPRDLVEDVAIAFGYDRLPQVGLASATFGQPHPREERARLARAALIGQGFLEVMTLALSSEVATFERCGVPDADRAVRLENPISVEQTIVRVSLLPGLLETLSVNLGHSYPQRICEVGLVSEVDPGAPTGAVERLHAAFALAGDGEGYASARSALDALLHELGPGGAADLIHRPSSAPVFLPGRGADLHRGDRRVGRVGEVHPAVLERHRIVHPVAVAEIDIDA